MGIGNRHKLSPDSAGTMCSSPHLHLPAVSAAVDDSYSSTRQGNYAKFGLALCRQTPPFPLLKSCNLECSSSCVVFNIFDFLTCRLSIFLSHLSIHLILIDQRSSLAMDHLILRCHYSQAYYIVVVTYHAVAKSRLPEKRSWHGISYLEILLLLATLVAYGNRGLCRFLLANGI